jgi:hypothetical protein
MPKGHVVQLTADQRAGLEGRFCGRMPPRERNRVQALLPGDRGDTDEEIADVLDICTATVVAIRKRLAADGREAALGERPRSGGPAKFDGTVEAAVGAVAGSPVPAGRAEWTVELIAGRLVGLKVVESISGRAVGRVLERVGSSRGRRRRGACPAG